MDVKFKQNKLNTAVGAAILSMSALPMLAEAGPYIVERSGTSFPGFGSVLQVSSFSTVNQVRLIDSMALVTNNGTIDTDALGEDFATAVLYGEDVNGSFVNNGFINAEDSLSTTVAAVGVNVLGDVLSTGSITVSGDGEDGGIIEAYGEDGDTVFAAGINVEGSLDVGGTITVEGGAEVDASAVSGGSVFASAIHVGSIEGDVTNNGQLDAYAAGGFAAIATGIHSDNISGNVTNGGVIDVYAASAAFALAGGIVSEDDVSGDISNTGTIEVDAGNAAFAAAGGIVVFNDLEGAITNDGLIDVYAGDVDDSAIAAGIVVFDEIGEDGSITNGEDGVINASVGFGEDISAIGIAAFGEDSVYGDIINNGVIEAYAAYGTTVDATGIYADHLYGSITNAGEIDAYAFRGEDVSATGIATGTVEASGSIEVSDGGSIFASAYSAYSAYAIGVETGDLLGTITNNGDITANAGYVFNVDNYSVTAGAFAAGIDSGNVSGTITNEGNISASAHSADAYSAYYAGAYVSAVGISADDVSGSIINNGMIDAEAYDADAYSAAIAYARATAAGIAADAVTGAITNNGDIYVDAYNVYSDDSYSATAIATGIDVDTLDAYGSITNSLDAVIDVFAGSAYSAYATGIYAGSVNDDASITNAGEIKVAATDAEFASAAGIYAGSVGEDASITNEGSITADAYYDAFSAYAAGIGVSTLYGSITNGANGEISAFASSASSNAAATGIWAGYVGEDGNITNNGSISATAYNYDSAYATGVGVGELYGSITNAEGASIDAGAYLTSYSAMAYATGIYANNVYGSANITNNGDINAWAENTYTSYGTIGAIGISINNLYGDLTNNGSINATASSASYAYATGISIGYVGGEDAGITNTGSIHAEVVYADYSTSAIGVYINDMSGVFNNSGSITIASYYDHAGYALDFEYGDGTFNNTAGGLVAGNVYLGEDNNFNNAGGTLAFAASSSGHESGYVGGNYYQGEDGVLQIGAYDGEDYGHLTVGEDVYLESNANIDVVVDADDNDLAGVEELRGVIDSYGEDGIDSDGTFNVTDNSFEFNFVGEIDGEDGERVDLTVVAMGSALEQVQEEGSPAAEGAAEVLDDLNMDPDGNSDEFNEELKTLTSLKTKKELADAIESTIPSISGGVAELTRNMAAALTRTVGARQGNRRGASSGDSAMSNRGFWLQPFGSEVDQDNRNGVTGYDIDSSGIALGIDADLSDTLNVGIAVAYVESDVESNLAVGSHDVDIESYQAKLYATKALSANSAINIQIGAGTSDYDSKRVLFNSSVAKADYDSWNAEVNVELEQSHQLSEQTVLTPYLFADYSYVEVDSYDESGAGVFNLDVNDDDADSLVLGVGLRANMAATDALSLTASASIGYDVMSDKSDLTAAFAGGGANFTTDGIEPDEVVYGAGLGLDYNITEGANLTVEYNVDGREDYTDQSIAAKLRFLF
ncbi:MAG: hypothetical protein COB22_08155 [Cycloclasticus sp.]|nr:MAG: hypothetical protein COB22_08155 [Cycloclasticus sp.]